MAPRSRTQSAHGVHQPRRPLSPTELRHRTVSSMVSAALLAVAGTLIFAWALRRTEDPWLFAVGVVPWVIALWLFGAAVWKYTRN